MAHERLIGYCEEELVASLRESCPRLNCAPVVVVEVRNEVGGSFELHPDMFCHRTDNPCGLLGVDIENIGRIAFGRASQRPGMEESYGNDQN